LLARQKTITPRFKPLRPARLNILISEGLGFLAPLASALGLGARTQYLKASTRNLKAPATLRKAAKTSEEKTFCIITMYNANNNNNNNNNVI